MSDVQYANYVNSFELHEQLFQWPQTVTAQVAHVNCREGFFRRDFLGSSWYKAVTKMPGGCGL